MNLEQRLALSYYKEIAVINKEHQIYLVQHVETRKLFVKKILSVYNLDIYNQLMEHPVAGTPVIYALCEGDKKLTVIEEYLTGDTLAEILKQSGPMDVHTACEYIYSVCQIVSRLHSFHPPIIHRDIKPSNVLISNYGQVFLLDFNAAKYYSEEQSEDTVLLGTHGFAAPEQYGFGASSVQTDVYSLGMLLKTLVEGAPIEYDPHADTFFTIVETCTRLNPWERYASVEELKLMLSRIIHNQDSNFTSNRLSAESDKGTDSSPESPTYPWYLLPGFRKLNPAGIVLSVIWYALFTFVSLTLEVVDSSVMDLIVERFLVFLMFLGSTLFVGNYQNIQRFFPFCNMRRKWLRILAVICYTTFYCFFCVLLATISSLVFN